VTVLIKCTKSVTFAAARLYYSQEFQTVILFPKELSTLEAAGYEWSYMLVYEQEMIVMTMPPMGTDTPVQLSG